jgi:hypothetical protein
MIRILFEKLKLIKPRQPHLPQTNVSGSLHSESDTLKEIWKYTCSKCGKGNNDTILAAIHKDYCR